MNNCNIRQTGELYLKLKSEMAEKNLCDEID